MPEIGELKKGQEIGMKEGYLYRWLDCKECTTERWVKEEWAKSKHYYTFCKKCSNTVRAKEAHLRDEMYWDGKSELKIGMKKSTIELRELGINYVGNNTMYWDECPSCGFLEWRLKPQVGKLCLKCHGGQLSMGKYGEESPHWNGGRYITNRGYIRIVINPNNPYYCMADDVGRIFEHDYIMAVSIGRPLNNNERVHHKGIKFLRESADNRQDNRIDNLKLFQNDSQHRKYHARLNRVDDLVYILKMLIIKEKNNA